MSPLLNIEEKEKDIIMQIDPCSSIPRNSIAIIVNLPENQQQTGGLGATQFIQNPGLINPHTCKCPRLHRKLTLEEVAIKFPAEVKILLEKYKQWKNDT